MAGRARISTARLAVVVACALTLSACGGVKNTGSASGSRPTTAARLEILDPTPSQVEPTDFTLKLRLIGATVVPQTTGSLRRDQGHIHVSLDGQLVSMAYGTSQALHAIKPGSHTIQAEFVAVDHAPFQNRVIAAVLFQVRP